MLMPFAPAACPVRWTRPRPVRVAHVDLDIRIDHPRRRVEGVVVHHVEVPAHARERVLELDQHGLDIQEVRIGDAVAAASRSGDRLAIALPAAGERFAVAVRFAAERPAVGLYFIDADPAGGQAAMAWTQGAMEDHAHWFPCFDDPNNLSTFRVAVRHPAAWACLSVGERTARDEHGDGTATTVHEQRRPHVLYLLTLVVGELVAVEDPSGPVPIAHWLPAGREASAPAMFRATAFAIRWLGDAIGVPFPWTRYGHAVVHGFPWGGMENTTLTTITDRVVMDAGVQAAEDVDCDSLVVHELVHQWFGDLLTMKAWSDIWLNESFATWLEAKGTAAWRATLGRDEADELELQLWHNRAAYLAEDGGRYRRPLVATRYVDAYELFDRVAYEKGSLVLHMLERLIGEPAMRAALALYVRRHAHDLVETADWRQAVEDVTGDPLDWFFDQWVHRAGHPALKVRSRHDPARRQAVVSIEQTQPEADGLWRLPAAIAWPGGRRRIVLDQRSATVVIPMDEAPAWVCLDPDGDLLAVWDEGDDAAALIARLAAGELSATARARACAALGGLRATAAIIAALAARLGDAGEAELVRAEAAAALGALDEAAARAALLGALPAIAEARLRRAIAGALAKPVRQPAEAEPLARALLAAADADPSRLAAGELLAARGAIEHPGATAELRSRMKQPSWNQRLRSACLRGLGASGEPAAADDCLAMLADASQVEGVRCAAARAAGALGARHLLLRDRVRRALEAQLASEVIHLRGAAAEALGQLGDPAARAALAERLPREPLGNLRRVIREADHRLAAAGAQTEAMAAATKRIDELEAARKKLEARLEAVEKRLG